MIREKHLGSPWAEVMPQEGMNKDRGWQVEMGRDGGHYLGWKNNSNVIAVFAFQVIAD